MSGQQSSPSRSPPSRSQPPRSAAETMMRWELLKVLTGVRDHRLDPGDVVEKLMASARSGELGDLFVNGPLDANKMENVDKALHALAHEQGEPEKEEKEAQKGVQDNSGLKPLSLPTRVDSTPASPPQRDGSVRRQGSVRSAKVRYRSSGDGHTLGKDSPPLNAPSTPPANASRAPSGSPGLPQSRPAGSSPPTPGQAPISKPQASPKPPDQPNAMLKDSREQPGHQKAPTATSMAGQHQSPPTQGQVPPKSAPNQPQRSQAPPAGPRCHPPVPNAQNPLQPMNRSNAQKIPPAVQQQVRDGGPPTSAQRAAPDATPAQKHSSPPRPAQAPVPAHSSQQHSPQPGTAPTRPSPGQSAPQRPGTPSRPTGNTPSSRPGSQHKNQSEHPPGTRPPPSQRPAFPQAQQGPPSGGIVEAHPRAPAASSRPATAQPNRAPAGQGTASPQSHAQHPAILQPNVPGAVPARQIPGGLSSGAVPTQKKSSMQPAQQPRPMSAQATQAPRPANVQTAKQGAHPLASPRTSAQGAPMDSHGQGSPSTAGSQRPGVGSTPSLSQHQLTPSQSSLDLPNKAPSDEKFAESKSVIDFDSSSESNDQPTPETDTETGSTESDETLLVEEMAAEAADVAHGIELVEGDFTPEEMFEMFLAGKLPKDWSSEQNTGSAVKLMSLGALYASQAYLGKGGRKIAVEVANSMGVFS